MTPQSIQPSGTPLDTLLDAAARLTGAPRAEIDPDQPIDETDLDEDYHDLFEDAAAAHGVPMIDIINTMPVYHIRYGDLTMTSLADLAAFSGRARRLLDAATTRVNRDTLRSMAQSVEAGRYVESGQMSDPIHQPGTRAGVLAKSGVIWLLCLGLPLLNAYGPCTPLCSDCLSPPRVRFWDAGIFTLPFAAVAHAYGLLPGLRILWQDRRKRARRRNV